jgi:hypothetical protein
VARGHDVAWLGNPAEESRILESGARFIATRDMAEADAWLMAHLVFDLDGIAKIFFGGRLTAQVADLRRALAAFPADCLLNDMRPKGRRSTRSAKCRSTPPSPARRFTRLPGRPATRPRRPSARYSACRHYCCRCSTHSASAWGCSR